MVFTQRVKQQLFNSDAAPVRLAAMAPTATTALQSGRKHRIRDRRRPGAMPSGKPWTSDEHDRFLTGLQMYPSGPWKMVTAIVQTRNARQTMTHAQKYRQKIAKRQRIATRAAAKALLATISTTASSETLEDAMCSNAVAHCPTRERPTSFDVIDELLLNCSALLDVLDSDEPHATDA